MLVDYAEHFWGEKHVGYHTLYENLKRGEDSVQELSSFVKDRISLEEDIFKSLNKSLIRVNQYINNNGAFVDSWRLTKGTIELYCEIQSSVLKNLLDLSKDVIKYHDDLVKSRKRVKVQDVVDAVNLMQTTTTCLQKAKETYQQRCAELQAMKNEPQSKEIIKMKSKVAKAHEEYKGYVEKYAHVRDNFEEKMLKSTKSFQAHDTAHLQQMKTFFTQLGRALDDAHGSISQVTGDYRNSLQQIDIENIMVKFVEEKGTGNEKPEPIKWTEADELQDDISHITSSHSAPSSSNSSAIVTNSAANHQQNVTNFIDLDSPTWTPTQSTLEINKTGDSDIADPSTLNAATTGSSNLTQFSSSLGRQKLAQWLPRRKKNSSQSSLSGTTNTTEDPTTSATTFGESNKGGFLKRYRKVKNSINDLTAMTEATTGGGIDDNKSNASSGTKSANDDKTINFMDGVRNDDLTPTTTNAPLVDEEGFIIRPEEKREKSQWSSCTSSDEEDEIEFQASKIRQLQINPVNESNTNINASVDELRNAIGHISLQRSTTFDKDPWSTITSSTSTSGPAEFSQSLNIGNIKQPLRAAFTGDEHLRRKGSAADVDFVAAFGQSTFGNNGINSSSTIARARPRSNTPTALTASAFGLNASMSGMSTIASNSRSTSTASSIDVFGESKGAPAAAEQNAASSSTFGFTDSFANFNTSSMSSSILPLSSASNASQNNAASPKRPIAMAVNEFAHAWFKQATPENPEVKVFGTVVISFPSILFPLLTDVTPELEAVKFSLEKAGQIQTIIPNKRLLLPTPLPTTPSETYNFTIDKLALANWLLDQKKSKPDANFYNVDIVRYELKSEDFVPPLLLRSYWKTGAEETGIRVDYSLNEISTIIEKPLLNITFTTKIDGQNAELTNSSPPATFDSETGTLTWLITELTKHGESSGSLKARVKINDGIPSATHVMFQTTDISFSKLSISINPETSYNLSMTKRKIIAGKYFCEPEVRN